MKTIDHGQQTTVFGATHNKFKINKSVVRGLSSVDHN
jgi:hypothetical protein